MRENSHQCRRMHRESLSNRERRITWNGSAEALSRMPHTSIYIGNLSPGVSPAELSSVLAPFGGEPAHIKLHLKGSSPYAFVKLPSKDKAIQAIRSLNGAHVPQLCSVIQHLRVRFAAFTLQVSGRTAEQEEVIAKPINVFVGDLCPLLSEPQFFNHFAEFMPRDATIMMDPLTKRSRGFGFVSFTTVKDAEAAIAAMNGAQLGTRRIRVAWAAHRLDQGEDGAGSPQAPSSPASAALPCGSTTMFLGNIPTDAAWGEQEAVALCSEFGSVVDLRLNRKCAYGFVTFETQEAAARAIRMLHGLPLQGQALKCSWGRHAPSLGASSGAARSASSSQSAHSHQDVASSVPSTSSQPSSTSTTTTTSQAYSSHVAFAQLQQQQQQQQGRLLHSSRNSSGRMSHSSSMGRSQEWASGGVGSSPRPNTGDLAASPAAHPRLGHTRSFNAYGTGTASPPPHPHSHLHQQQQYKGGSAKAMLRSRSMGVGREGLRRAASHISTSVTGSDDPPPRLSSSGSTAGGLSEGPGSTSTTPPPLYKRSPSAHVYGLDQQYQQYATAAAYQYATAAAYQYATAAGYQYAPAATYQYATAGAAAPCVPTTDGDVSAAGVYTPQAVAMAGIQAMMPMTLPQMYMGVGPTGAPMLMVPYTTMAMPATCYPTSPAAAWPMGMGVPMLQPTSHMSGPMTCVRQAGGSAGLEEEEEVGGSRGRGGDAGFCSISENMNAWGSVSGGSGVTQERGGGEQVAGGDGFAGEPAWGYRALAAALAAAAKATGPARTSDAVHPVVEAN